MYVLYIHAKNRCPTSIPVKNTKVGNSQFLSARIRGDTLLPVALISCTSSDATSRIQKHTKSALLYEHVWRFLPGR